MRKAILVPVLLFIPLTFASSNEDCLNIKIHFNSFDEIRWVESLMTRLDEPIGLLGYFCCPAADTAALSKRGLKYEICEFYVTRVPSITELDSFYYTYDAMIETLQTWANRFPLIAHTESIGVSQQELRKIYAFKISDNVDSDEDEAVALFDGTHHACEIMGMEICLALIDTLLRNYGQQQSITNLIDNTEIWIVPLMNPDGNSAVHSDISLNYRKNGRDLDNDGILYEYGCNNSWTCPTEGVDINRNYDWYWSYSGSSTPRNYYYRGPTAASESEITAITSLIAGIRPVVSLTYHSWGEVIFYPWVWDDGSVTPDHDLFVNIAASMAQNIERENNMGIYDIEASDGSAGMALNWQYARYGVISFLPETVAAQDFIPETEARKNAVVANNLQGVFYILERVHQGQIWGHVSDIRTGIPVQAEIKILEHYSSLVNARISDSLYGAYRRLLLPGNYTLEVSSPGYPIRLINNIMVIDSIPTRLDIRLGAIIAGDANDSGTLNGVDVIYLVNYLKGTGPIPNPVEQADANGDCLLNGLDPVYLVNFFKGGTAPIPCDDY